MEIPLGKIGENVPEEVRRLRLLAANQFNPDLGQRHTENDRRDKHDQPNLSSI